MFVEGFRMAPGAVEVFGAQNLLGGAEGDELACEQQGQGKVAAHAGEIVQYGDGCVGARPVAEIARLHAERLLAKKDFTLHSGENALKGLHSRHCEIAMEFEAGSQGTLYLELNKSERGEEKAVVIYDGVADAIYVEAGKCGGAGRSPGDAAMQAD